jgi:general nucleoside transport system ATP-binding protein
LVAMTNGEATLATPLLETRKLTKRFGELVANAEIDLAIYPGEVHAILGENGAGKSTLMKSLYGFHQPTAGEILIQGQPTTIASPEAGRRLGIGMVFQNFTLIPAMTVLENIALFLPDMGRVIRQQELHERITSTAARYGLEINPAARVADLAMGERQKVEILKILLAGARILIFDEPTSVLAPHEVDGLFQIFARLTADRYAVLFITHKLPEVMATCQRITILRRGAVAGTLLRAAANEDAIVRIMLGAAPPQPAQRVDERKHTGEPLLAMRGVKLVDLETGIGLKEIDLEIHPGEIVGVAGVSGNGQSELGDVILGLRPLDGGSVWLHGREATAWPTAERLRAGLAYIPEDPIRMGAVPGMTVLENMVLGEEAKFPRAGGLAIDWPRARQRCGDLLSTTFLTTPPGLGRSVETLSGGNMQRVVIAREVGREPQLLLAYYPARGLDLANAEAMRQLLLQQRAKGVGILLISEDLHELFALSDRLIVLYHGRIVGDFTPQTTDAYTVGHLMTGGQG